MRTPPVLGIETMIQGGIEHRELSIQILLGNWNHQFRLGQSGSPTTLLALPHLTNSWFRGSNKLCLSTCTTGFRTFWTKYPSCKRKRMCRLLNQYSRKQWYCWWKESCTTWDVNNGISTISTGAGFLPSTATMALWYIYPRSNQDLPLRWQNSSQIGTFKSLSQVEMTAAKRGSKVRYDFSSLLHVCITWKAFPSQRG